VDKIRHDPNDMVALLRLTHLYAQVWIRAKQPDVIPRIMQCLRRALQLDDGTHAKQIGGLIQGLGRHFDEAQNAEALTELRELENQLNAKMLLRTPEEPEQAPVEKHKGRQPVPEPVYPKPDEDAEEVEIPEVAHDEIVAQRPRISASASVEAPKEPSSPELDADFHVETVKPDPQEKPSEKALAQRRREIQHKAALSAAEEISEIRTLFEEERVEDILKFYASCMEPREKRYIGEQLAARIEEWGIGPLMAIAALESDEQIFRQVMRWILKSNRTAVCDEIDLASYSPDLQRVGAVVLSELGIRAALPKLVAALDLPDPVVRSVAVHGLGRAGKAASQYIPALVKTVESDPHANVRRAAAKAIADTGMREAWEQLEEAANKTRFDSSVYLELEKMRKQYGAADKPQKESEAPTPGKAASSSFSKPKSSGMSPKAAKNLLGTIVVLVVVAFACWYLWKKLKPPDYYSIMLQEAQRIQQEEGQQETPPPPPLDE